MADREKKEALKCPGCGGALKEVFAEANYGRILVLDQCPGCGGVWFDRWELYFVKDSSLEGLTGLDVGMLLHEVRGKKGANECPRCKAGLKDFTDPTLPEDAVIERCPGCSGLWLNRGVLKKYSTHRAAFKGRIPRGPLIPSASPERIEALKRLQKELKTASLTDPGHPAVHSLDEPITPEEFATDVGFLILQALFRLLFKF